jgi:hypothetical protein
MTMTHDEAAKALSDIEQAGAHSKTLKGYERASPYLMMWGLLWIVAGTVAQVSPANTSVAWWTVDAIGIAGSLYLAVSQSRERQGEAKPALFRVLMLCAILGAFNAAVFNVFAPVNGAQVMSFAGLLCAVIYMVVGQWFGARYVVLGATLFVTTLVGFFVLTNITVVFISWAGGASIALSGLWLRRA